MATDDIRRLMERDVDPKILAQVRVDEAYARGRMAGLAIVRSLNNLESPMGDEPPTREELDEIARRNSEYIAQYAARIRAEAVQKLREERGQR